MTDTPEYKGLYGEPLLDNATSLGAAEFERIVVAFRFNRLGLTSVDVAALIATVRAREAERDKWFDKLIVEQGMTAMYKTAEERALDWNSQANIRAEQAEDRAEKAEAELAEARAGGERTFPLQVCKDIEPGPKHIPWSIAEKAYGVYVGKYGRCQSLERLAERGGFGWDEMDNLYPKWRAEVGEISELKSELAEAREALRQILGWRERDLWDMADVIKFIEDTARAALNPEKSDG